MSDQSRHPVHYELFVRRHAQGAWVLELAAEPREQVVRAAEEIFQARKGVAVRVSKEMLNPETGIYSSAIIFSKGAEAGPAAPRPAGHGDMTCTRIQDLYGPAARETMARLLSDWLAREKVTPFELLHRPDLAQKLEGSAHELQHVVQKCAIAQSHDTGQDLHECLRWWQAFIDKAISRLVSDGQKNRFAGLEAEADLLDLVGQLGDDPERDYLFGGALAHYLIPLRSAGGKLARLLPLAERLHAHATASGAEDIWALAVVEGLVTELFSRPEALHDILGHEADAGEVLVLLSRMTFGFQTAGALPEVLKGPEVLNGYGGLMAQGAFDPLRTYVIHRLVAQLRGPRRLSPGKAEREIEILRDLATCLTLTGKAEGLREDILEAFVERSRLLVSCDFVDALRRDAEDAVQEVERLIWLCENVVGAANKRQAGQWLLSCLSAMKFERELCEAVLPITVRLSILARLEKRIREANFPEPEVIDLLDRLGKVGDQMAKQARLWAHLARSPAPPLQKLQILLALAAGQTGPSGPVADTARAEAMTLLRREEVRRALGTDPEAIDRLKPLIHAAGIAA